MENLNKIYEFQDDYNRFETARHAMNSRANRSQTSQEKEEIRFGGFGDRAGSGVELTGFNWSGGEVSSFNDIRKNRYLCLGYQLSTTTSQSN